MGRVLLAAVVALLLSAAPALADPPGTLTKQSYAGGYLSLTYVPKSLDRSKPAPVWVMLHGCGNTMYDMNQNYGLDEMAERHHFVVFYPDGDPAVHPERCWRSTTDILAGSAEPKAIADMVRTLIAKNDPTIDAQRVYLAGHSSGAMMATVLAATASNVFAAVLVDAGCAYAEESCIGLPPAIPSEPLARLALNAMGDHPRVVPIINIHGDKDPTVPFRHSQQVIDQWRMTDNLVASGDINGPIAAKPSTARKVDSAGLTSTVETYDLGGCEVIERWAVHGEDHRWPGGTSSPPNNKFTDPRGPDNDENGWRFFSRFTLAGPIQPCAPDIPADAPASTCTPGTLKVKLPAHATAVRVKIAGKAVKAKRSGRTLRIPLRQGNLRIVVSAKVSKKQYSRVLRRKVC